ncbi:MAG: DUF3783 domain-containing protein [Thermodesulfobacteriota bacterium]
MSQGEFKKIDQEEGAPLGPPALLLCGFSFEESRTLSSFLGTIDASEHRVVLCTEPMLARSLREALTTAEESPPVPPDKLPRAIVLSGMGGARVRVFLDQYASTQLPRPIFATVTPSNLDFTVRDLLVELLQEHRAMSERK